MNIDNPPVRTYSWVRRLLEYLIAFTLLLIPAGATFLSSWSMPAEYTQPSPSVPVSEVGVQGSVHFAVVEGGYTDNLIERLFVYLNYDGDYRDIAFEEVEAESSEEYADEFLETESMTYTLEQAVHAAAELNENEATYEHEIDPEVEAKRLSELMEQLEGFYGNSLGLMVGVGLYEEENDIDFSKGGTLKISGTGTMEEDGWVGSIGGLEQKLIAAEAEDVDIFFVPADYEWWGEDSNEAEAERVKKERDLQFKIVPVESLYEAIDYLLYET
ncbi:hypothetical protein D3C74_53060 [compost metagenome]